MLCCFGHLRTFLLLIAVTTTLTTSVTSTSWNGKKLTTATHTNTIMTQFRKRNHGRDNNRRQPPTMSSSSSSSSLFQSINNKSTTNTKAVLQHLTTSIPPSGSICDSNLALFTKVGIAAILETVTLTGLLLLGRLWNRTNPAGPRFRGLSLGPWVGLFVVVFASSVVGAVVDGGLSAATNQVLDPNVVPGEPGWYANLNRPWWEPPGWVFPIMWLIVSKPTQLVALSRLLTIDTAVGGDDGSGRSKIPLELALGVYGAHLALGDAWNKVFFGYQCIGRGVAVITMFFGMLLTSAVLFGRVDDVAGRFMLPTCGWVAIATSLNWSIYFRNK